MKHHKLYDRITMAKLLIFCCLLSCYQVKASYAIDTPYYLVLDKKPCSVVVISMHLTDTEKLAASELIESIKKISGATLTIDNQIKNDTNNYIVIGTPNTSSDIKAVIGKISNEFDKIKKSDGFYIFEENNKVYIIGDQPKGVLNGVYDFLEKNTGIIWTRSVETGDIFTKAETIKVTKTNYGEKSPFDIRGWHSCGFGDENHSDPQTQLMLSRNKINLDMVEFGNVREPVTHSKNGVHGLLAGHNLNKWLPNDKYFEAHPEYYCLVDGKRVPVGPNTGQVNFAHPNVAKEIANNVMEYLKNAPKSMDYIGITAEDNSIFDQSELSTKPIKTDNGIIVQPTDPAYKSTIFFMFFNKVTQIVRAKYPDVKMVTFAYLFTDEPPVCDIDKNILIMYAPLSECDRHPLNSNEKNCLPNYQYNQKLVKWVKKTNNLIIYNYYGSFESDKFERPIEEKVQIDLQYYKKLGVKGILPEGQADLITKNQSGWAVNAMRFWIMNRLFWNPDLNISELRNEYLSKAYGKAFSAMQNYSGLIEKGWLFDQAHIGWQISGLSLFSQYVVNSGISDDCLKYLNQAISDADNDVKPKIETIKNVFTANMLKVADLGTQSAKVSKTSAKKNDILNTFDFSTGAWANSTIISDFRISGTYNKILAETKVYLMWDDENIYVGYDNKDTNVDKTVASDSIVGNWWPNDDDVETYLTGDMNGNEKYYALMSNAKSLKLDYSGPDRDPSYNPKWECKSVIYKEGWKTIQVIPFRSMEVNIYATRQLKAQFFRTYHINGEGSYCGWLGGSVWNYLDMKLLQLVD